jgi:glutamate-1-semialdehyde 2,1-aminomutase
MVDRVRLTRLLAAEKSRYRQRNLRSAAGPGGDTAHLLCGVPMTWMAEWPGGFPLLVAGARGAEATDVDGHTYADFCLGDTGAMAGHSPEATVAAIVHRARELGGLTTMLPSEDGAAVAAELASRFGVGVWSFTLSATDANRFVLRIARQVTRRPKVLVFNYCYHGTVDESFATLDRGQIQTREGNVGPPIDVAATTRVVEFNDLDGVERALARGDVAAVLTEPALTNIGIVLPAEGFLAGLAELCRAAGTLLVIDETHTLSAGPGGCTAAWGLHPDAVTLGKAIGGGVPCGAYGLSADLADRIVANAEADLVDVGGIGGTLAGNVLSLAAMRATLADVLTPEAFKEMGSVTSRLETGVRGAIESAGLPWSITRLGARAEYRYLPHTPHSGGESAAAGDRELDEFLHLYLANRDVLLTPFHNMALSCPATTTRHVDALVGAFGSAVAELVA